MLGLEKRARVLSKIKRVPTRQHMRHKGTRMTLVKAYERVHAKATPQLIHRIAKDKGVDHESKKFMDKCKEWVGERHLDKMSDKQITAVAKRLIISYEMSQKERRAALQAYGLA